MRREALHYVRLEENAVRCDLCAQQCTIREGKRGVCGVRENEGGVLLTDVYGLVAAAHVDPVEKKPFFHFHPGSTAFSLATVGCNFRCTFCQNWSLSQASKGAERHIDGEHAEPERIADEAAWSRSRVVAFTYSEPTIFYEWAYDVARETTARGMANVFVTNGYIAEAPLREIRPYLHGANVDLKAFRDESYHHTMGAPGVGPVLDALRLMRALGIWVEVTTLVVPTRNDSPEELRDIARFVSHELGPDVPWHVSRFHPDYRDAHLPPTPVATLRRAYEIGREEGLRYVYTGNLPGDEGEHTRCHACGAMLIRRYGFRVVENFITDAGACPDCGVPVAGHGMARGERRSAEEAGRALPGP